MCDIYRNSWKKECVSILSILSPQYSCDWCSKTGIGPRVQQLYLTAIPKAIQQKTGRIFVWCRATIPALDWLSLDFNEQERSICFVYDIAIQSYSLLNFILTSLVSNVYFVFMMGGGEGNISHHTTNLIFSLYKFSL